MRVLFFGWWLLAVSLIGADAQTILTMKDVEGKAHAIVEKGSIGTALFFVTNDCPIGNAYSPEMNRIVSSYSTKGVRFFMVYIDRDFTVEQIKKHAKEFGYRCPQIADPKVKLAKKFGATVTPEAVVLTRDGSIAYRGRIDDLYADFGKRRSEPTRRDLRMALDEYLSGKPITVRRTKAIGCFIPTN